MCLGVASVGVLSYFGASIESWGGSRLQFLVSQCMAQVTADHLWPTTVFRTFATLITQDGAECQQNMQLCSFTPGSIFKHQQ